MLNSDKPLFDMIAKMEQTCQNMFGPGADLVIRLGNLNTGGIVFKSTTNHLRFCEANREATSTEFQKKVLEVDNFTKRGRQSNQLSFSGTKCNKLQNQYAKVPPSCHWDGS